MIQLRVIKPIAASVWTEPNRKPGDVVWVRDMMAARHLIEAGMCAWLEGGPTVAQDAGPSSKKYAGERQHGPSTDSPLSNQSGRAKRSSLLGAAQALTPRHLIGFMRRRSTR